MCIRDRVLYLRVEIKQAVVRVDAFQQVLDAETLAADVLHLALVPVSYTHLMAQKAYPHCGDERILSAWRWKHRPFAHEAKTHKTERA